MLTMRQKKGHITAKARRRRRLDIIIRVSREGGTKAEAAVEAGMTVNGVNSLLASFFGTQKWPLADEE